MTIWPCAVSLYKACFSVSECGAGHRLYNTLKLTLHIWEVIFKSHLKTSNFPVFSKLHFTIKLIKIIIVCRNFFKHASNFHGPLNVQWQHNDTMVSKLENWFVKRIDSDFTSHACVHLDLSTWFHQSKESEHFPSHEASSYCSFKATSVCSSLVTSTQLSPICDISVISFFWEYYVIGNIQNVIF